MILCEECVKTFGKENALPATMLMVTETILAGNYRAKFTCDSHSVELYQSTKWENTRANVYFDTGDNLYVS